MRSFSGILWRISNLIENIAPFIAFAVLIFFFFLIIKSVFLVIKSKIKNESGVIAEKPIVKDIGYTVLVLFLVLLIWAVNGYIAMQNAQWAPVPMPSNLPN